MPRKSNVYNSIDRICIVYAKEAGLRQQSRFSRNVSFRSLQSWNDVKVAQNGSRKRKNLWHIVYRKQRQKTHVERRIEETKIVDKGNARRGACFECKNTLGVLAGNLSDDVQS